MVSQLSPALVNSGIMPLSLEGQIFRYISRGKFQMSLPINKTLLYIGLSLSIIFLAVTHAKAQSSDYLNIQVLLDDVQKKHRDISSKLYGYTFTLRRTEQQLDDRGRVKKETVKVF